MNGVHALVLAAGAGTRFGGGKLLAAWRGVPLVHGALRAALAAPVDSVRVVLGAEAAAVEAAARRVGADLRFVLAEDHAAGLSASLQAGVRSLPGDALGVLVFLGDMPNIPASTAAELVEALSSGATAAVPIFEGRRGNPVALGRDLFPRLMTLTGDRGARGLLDELGDAVALVVAADAGVLFDVDQPADLLASS